MAGLTFTLRGVSFGALASGNGRYALKFSSAPIDQFTRYKIYGVAGSLVNFGDNIGWKIMATVRYIGTTPYASYYTDVGAFRAFPGTTITGPDGHAYTRSILEPGGSRIIRDAVAMGRGVGGQQFLDASFEFISDGG